MESGDGTVFLVYGAPGAGKTALLDQCRERAEKQGWNAVRIRTDTLLNPRKMMRALGYGKIPSIDTISVNLSDAVKMEIMTSKANHPHTSDVVGKRKKKPLLLIMDESQKLASAHEHPIERREDLEGLLEDIHNGELNKPVILLAAGLATTPSVFRSLGISRFSEKYNIKLGPLSKNSERAVIFAWITKDANVTEDPEEWIDAIVKETHGWARHVHSYARHASEYLKANGRIMTPDGLKAVLELGRSGRIQYYEQRTDEFYADQLQCLIESIPDAFSGIDADMQDIMSALINKYGKKEAKNLFDSFIEKGILEKNKDGLFIVTPSLHSWLVDEYGKN